MFGGQSSKGQRGVAAGVQTDANAAKIAAADVAGKHKHPSLHSGAGLFYFGPMTVNSRAHDVSMRDGECTGRGRLRSYQRVCRHRQAYLGSVSCD